MKIGIILLGYMVILEVALAMIGGGLKNMFHLANNPGTKWLLEPKCIFTKILRWIYGGITIISIIITIFEYL